MCPATSRHAHAACSARLAALMQPDTAGPPGARPVLTSAEGGAGSAAAAAAADTARLALWRCYALGRSSTRPPVF